MINMFRSEVYDLCFQCLRATLFAVNTPPQSTHTHLRTCSEFGSLLTYIWERNVPTSSVMRITYKTTVVNKREAVRAPCNFLPKLKLYGLICKKKDKN